MRETGRRAIVVAASSDIGEAMCRRWRERGWQVAGTYRTDSPAVASLRAMGVALVECDLAKRPSIRRASGELLARMPEWDVLVLGSGTQEPVGLFPEVEFEDWEHSIQANFLGQMAIVHALLPARHRGTAWGSSVLWFAGGGTNNATSRYSAYTVSKIALIKTCELLDAEVPDTRFVIVGPGWVRTKIHAATIAAGARAGANHERTLERLANDDFVPMDRVLDCCDWLLEAPRSAVGGRNFSIVHDAWGGKDLVRELARNPDMYKLRRSGNDWRPEGG